MLQQQVLGLYSRLKEREDERSDHAIFPLPFEELYLESSPYGFQLYLFAYYAPNYEGGCSFTTHITTPNKSIM